MKVKRVTITDCYLDGYHLMYDDKLICDVSSMHRWLSKVIGSNIEGVYNPDDDD